MTKTEASQVYVQLRYDEALESKKELLSSEISLLNLIKTVKNYNALRIEELKVKSKINKLAKELGTKIKIVQYSFPFLKIPQKVGEINERKIETAKKRLDSDIESQLRDIQERLKIIGKR